MRSDRWFDRKSRFRLFVLPWAALGLTVPVQPVQSKEESYSLPDPDLWEGARPGHYADYFADLLAKTDFETALQPEDPRNPFGSFDEEERFSRGVALIDILTDVARASPHPEVPCTMLDPAIAAIDPALVVSMHASAARSRLDDYEPKLLAALGRMYEARVRGCTTQLGSNHTRTRAVIAARDALYKTIADSQISESSEQWGNGADGTALSLLTRHGAALGLGDFRAAAIYRNKASDRIADLRAAGTVDEYLARANAFIGVFSGIEQPGESNYSAADLGEDSRKQIDCQVAMRTAINAGWDHARFMQSNTGVCPTDPSLAGASPVPYFEMAERAGNGLFKAGEGTRTP